MPLVFGYSGQIPKSPASLGHSDDQRDSSAHTQPGLSASGSPSPFPSGWEDFLRRWALGPEFTAVGSSHSSKYMFFFPRFRGGGWLWGKKSWDYLKAGWEDPKVCWKNDTPASQRISHTPNGSSPWETLLNERRRAGDGIRHSSRLRPHRMLIQLGALSAPFSLGSDQERGQPCHPVSQGANSGGCQGSKVKHWCQ